MDVFRPKGSALTKEQVDLVKTIKALANNLYEVIVNHMTRFSITNAEELIDGQAKNYEFYNAIEKLEECVMWATKGVTKTIVNK